MKVADALQGVTSLFLDTAPIIYYIEKYPQYFPVMSSVFQYIDSNTMQILTSPITLAECLVNPIRQGLGALQ